MKLAICVAHAGADTLYKAVDSWTYEMAGPQVFIAQGNNGILPAYEEAWRRAAEDGYDIFAFFHDDLIIKDADWLKRVLFEFEDPGVGMVGFAGALEHGSDNLYKAPYEMQQLGRSHFLSNMEDAEVHGKRFTGSCNIAVLDGMALIVRKRILEMWEPWHGWPVGTDIGYSWYDYAICCETHAQRYDIRLVGIPVKHYGGRTAIALKMAPPTGESHDKAHLWIYEQYRDKSVLPYKAR